MPSRNVDLTPEQDAFVAALIAGGRYRDAGEVLRDAIAQLQRRWTLDGSDDPALRAAIEAGLTSLDRGAFTEIEDADLDLYLDGLAAGPGR